MSIGTLMSFCSKYLKSEVYIMRCLFNAAQDRSGFPKYIANLSLGKLGYLMEVTGGNIWHATNIWSRFPFLGDQTIHIKFNCIQSLQYLHLFTYTYKGLLCSVLRFTIHLFFSYRFYFLLAFRLERTLCRWVTILQKAKSLDKQQNTYRHISSVF